MEEGDDDGGGAYDDLPHHLITPGRRGPRQ